MGKVDFQLLTIQLLMILILFFTIIKLLKVRKSIDYSKRVGRYAIDSIKDVELSFFDKLSILVWKIIKGLSKLFNKSKFIKKIGNKYDKYISYEDKKVKEGIDYISIKLLIGILFVIFNIFTYMFQYVKINYYVLIITFIIGFFIYDIFLKIEYQSYRRKIENDLLKAVIIMNNSFKSGRNIMQAINNVIKQLDGPIQDEFKKINLDITYGLSLDIVFDRFYERVKLDDAKYIASSLTLLNKTGGNIVNVFNSIEKSFFSRKKLRDEIKTLTASSILMFRILLILPFALIIIILMLNNTYFNVLFESTIGVFIVIFTFLLFVIYLLLVKRIMKVDLNG